MGPKGVKVIERTQDGFRQRIPLVRSSFSGNPVAPQLPSIRCRLQLGWGLILLAGEVSGILASFPDVAQWIEHRSSEPRVGGSNPFVRAILPFHFHLQTLPAR